MSKSRASFFVGDPLLKTYAYVLYVLRRTMVTSGSKGVDTWLSLVLLTWAEIMPLQAALGVAEVIRGKFFSFGPIGITVAMFIVVGGANYLCLIRRDQYKDFDQEFAAYPARKTAWAIAGVYSMVAIAVLLLFLSLEKVRDIPCTLETNCDTH